MKIFNLNSFLFSKFKNKNISKYGFAVLCLIIIFLFAFKAPSDPDLGWHLKTGELIWQTKSIPHIDPYSYTMSDFPWIDHDWLSEVFIYGIYKNFGILGNCLFYAFIILFVFAYLLPKTTIKKISPEIAILLGAFGALICMPYVGIRPQVIGLVGIACILVILNELYKNGETKKIFFLPLIFLFWTNMHPSFGMGLIVLANILLIEKMKIRRLEESGENEWIKRGKTLDNKSWKKLFITSLVCFGTTTITPYGPRIYLDFKRTLCDSYGTSAISEWLSANFHTLEGILLAFLLLIIIEILALRKKRIDPTQFTLLIGFLWFALQSVRHIPLLVVISAPILLETLSGTIEKIISEVLRVKVIFIGLIILSAIYIPQFIPIQNTIKEIQSPDALAKQNEYPKKAIEFLKENPQQGNMFNDYAWGGYIIWHYPGVKTFIDGRMAHWKIKSLHILKEYNEIISVQENWQDLLKKHNIEWTFIRKKSCLAKILKLSPEWQEIYQDETAVIFKKK